MFNFLEEAQKIISIRSVSMDGNEDVANYCLGLMKRLNLKTSLQQVGHSLDGISKKQFNVIGILGDPLVDASTKKGLLLNTHIDTVGPGLKSNWTECGGDPFTAAVKGDRIYGLGTADVKLDFLCKLKALERYRDRKLKMPVYLVGSAAEEIGMLGAKYLVKSKLLNPKYVVVGEPSELAVVYAHKAFSAFHISVGFQQKEKDSKGFNKKITLKTFGRSAHGSYPQHGDNAIYKLLDALRAIRDANFQFRISSINGGELVNKVPDSAQVEFYISSASFDDFKRFFQSNLASSGAVAEVGGVGDVGVGFMPDTTFEVIDAVKGIFETMSYEMFKEEDTTFNPATSTMNFGKLASRLGNQGSIDLMYDVRLLPSVSVDEFFEHLKDKVQACNARYPQLSFKLNRTRMNYPLDTSRESDLVKAAADAQKAAGIGVKLDKKATSTEAAEFYMHGHDAIVFGPGVSMGNSHSPNEYNLVDHLDKAIQFYDRLIERLCV